MVVKFCLNHITDAFMWKFCFICFTFISHKCFYGTRTLLPPFPTYISHICFYASKILLQPLQVYAYFIELFAYAVNQPLNLGDLELATIRSDKTLLIFYGTLVVVGAWHWGSTNPI